MSNPKPHVFTFEERSKGGKAQAVSKLRTNKLTEFLSEYIEGDPDKIGSLSMSKDFRNLSERDRLNFLMAYMPYERPKQSSEERKEERTLIVMSEEDKIEKMKQLKEILNKTE